MSCQRQQPVAHPICQAAAATAVLILFLLLVWVV